jgi:hypothetical protein
VRHEAQGTGCLCKHEVEVGVVDVVDGLGISQNACMSSWHLLAALETAFVMAMGELAVAFSGLIWYTRCYDSISKGDVRTLRRPSNEDPPLAESPTNVNF